ncbi:hypothetical protein HK097_001291, partial [Rhizophlyctis rosea]
NAEGGKGKEVDGVEGGVAKGGAGMEENGETRVARAAEGERSGCDVDVEMRDFSGDGVGGLYENGEKMEVDDHPSVPNGSVVEPRVSGQIPTTPTTVRVQRGESHRGPVPSLCGDSVDREESYHTPQSQTNKSPNSSCPRPSLPNPIAKGSPELVPPQPFTYTSDNSATTTPCVSPKPVFTYDLETDRPEFVGMEVADILEGLEGGGPELEGGKGLGEKLPLLLGAATTLGEGEDPALVEGVTPALSEGMSTGPITDDEIEREVQRKRICADYITDEEIERESQNAGGFGIVDLAALDWRDHK